jgi:hypothetical protein
LPSQDTCSALLALSTCCQIMGVPCTLKQSPLSATDQYALQDTSSGYLYSNMALSMSEFVEDLSPELSTSCKFLKRIRQNPAARTFCHPPTERVPGQGDHARFMDIVGFMMMCMRSQHLQHIDQAWPINVHQVFKPSELGPEPES